MLRMAIFLAEETKRGEGQVGIRSSFKMPPEDSVRVVISLLF